MIPVNLRMAAPPLYTGAVCAYPWDEGLARQFTIPSRYEDDEPMRLWNRIDEKTMGLPWHCCPPSADDRRVAGWQTHWSSPTKPRTEEQKRVLSEMVAIFGEQGLSGVLQSPTGSGKTALFLMLMAYIQRSALVVVPKDDLVDQWIDRIVEHTSLRRPDVGRLQQNVIDVRGRPIVVGSLKSVSMLGRYPPWVYESFGVLGIDEVHRCGADMLGQVLHLFKARQRIGLSATPSRGDGKDLVVEAHVGPIRVVGKDLAMKPKVYVLQSQWKHPRDNQGERIPVQAGKIATLLKSLCRNGARNKIICQLAKMCYERKRKLVIFSDYIEDHLANIEMLLPSYGIPPDKIGRYYGSTTKAQLLHAAEQPVILATYAKMSEGTDIPLIDAGIPATPRSNIKQALGRIARSHPDKQHPVWFDIVDPDSPVLVNYAKARMKVYAELGLTVEAAEI